MGLSILNKTMKRAIKMIAASAFVLVCQVGVAQNPYMPLWEFIPDGEPYVFEDPDVPGKYRVYVYGSHDNLINYYCGRDQVVWSAPVDDLQNWRLDGTIFVSDKDGNGNLLYKDGTGDVLYAPDVLETKDKDGKKVYYLYPNTQHNDRGSMVAKSYRPDGPFEVCNWDKENAQKTVGPFGFDPAAFVDDDGRVYGYWGFEHSYAAELDPATMATVKPGTEIVDGMIPGKAEDKTFRFFEASSIRKIKDKYVFVYSRWTNDGEFGLPESNYTLAYCYSNNPLGPWTYGGTIIDGRGREKRTDGTTIATATPNGNTHGSICEINGKWWVFYHRQSGTNEYCRQAMVAPIEVEVMEGNDGYVRISEAEFTSEGFATEGLDPLKRYAAGIACYFTGPRVAYQEYPNVIYSGSHTQEVRIAYDGKRNAYDKEINKCPMVNNTDGSIFGYKYFDFRKTFGKENLKLYLKITNENTTGHIDIMLDRPTIAEGGVKIGELDVDGKVTGKEEEKLVDVNDLKHYNGKHAIFLVFTSEVKEKSICVVNEIGFKM